MRLFSFPLLFRLLLRTFYFILADPNCSTQLIGYWYDNVVCLSVCLSVLLSVSKYRSVLWLKDTSYSKRV